MRKLGLVTIGQTPREDIVGDLIPIFGPEVELLQAGALDPYTREDIEGFLPNENELLLITRLRDGSSVFFPERYILPGLQECIHRLERQGAEMILFLCTEAFPEFESSVPLIFPCDILNGAVPALCPRSRAAVLVPKEEQIPQAYRKWKGMIQHLEAMAASPFGAPEELEAAARACADLDVDLIVLDCIGYTSAMKEKVHELSGKPVVLSRTLAARLVMELLS